MSKSSLAYTLENDDDGSLAKQIDSIATAAGYVRTDDSALRYQHSDIDADEFCTCIRDITQADLDASPADIATANIQFG